MNHLAAKWANVQICCFCILARDMSLLVKRSNLLLNKVALCYFFWLYSALARVDIHLTFFSHSNNHQTPTLVNSKPNDKPSQIRVYEQLGNLYPYHTPIATRMMLVDYWEGL